MSYHNQIADYFFELLENNYYKHLKQLYNKKIDEIMNIEKISILKAEHFILLQYYFVYLINKSITTKSYIFITIFTNGFYSLDITNNKIINNFYIEKQKNLIYFKKYSSIILYYTIFFKMYISCSINFYYKFLLFSFLSSYYLLYNINFTYKKRLEYIQNNKNDNDKNDNDKNNNDINKNDKNIDNDYSRLLLFTSNKNTLKEVIKYTEIFKFPLFIFFFNIFLLIIC